MKNILILLLTLVTFGLSAQVKPQQLDKPEESVLGDLIFILGNQTGYGEFKLDSLYCGGSGETQLHFTNIKTLSTRDINTYQKCVDEPVIPTIVDNGDGTYKMVDGNGDTLGDVIVDTNTDTNVSDVFLNLAGTSLQVGVTEDGTTIQKAVDISSIDTNTKQTTPIPSVAVDNGDGTETVTYNYNVTDKDNNVLSAESFTVTTDIDTKLTDAEVCAAVAANCGASLTDFTPTIEANGSTTYAATFTGNDGATNVVSFNIAGAVDTNTIPVSVVPSTPVDNGDGTVTTTNTLNLTDKDGNALTPITWDDVDRNTQNTISVPDASIIVNPSLNPDGTINYGLRVPTIVYADDTDCIAYDDKTFVTKSDGSKVWKKASSYKRKEVFPTGDYTVLEEDNIIAAVGGATITLPSCINNCSEKTIYRDACTTGSVIVAAPMGEYIDYTDITNEIIESVSSYTYECVNGAWRTKAKSQKLDVSEVLFSLNNTTSASVEIHTTDGQPYSVDWGDGSVSSNVASGTTASHAYSTAYTGDVKIQKLCGISPIYRAEFISGNWDFDINQLNQLVGLTEIVILSGTVSGDIANLPSGVTYVYIGGQNTLLGDIANLPNGVTFVYIQGQNTLTGDIANLPSGVTYLNIRGQNTLSGDIANLPSGVTFVDLTGQNTLSGDIANLPIGVTSVVITGQNTLTGDIANLPSGVTSVNIQGQNTLTGDIANLPSGVTYVVIQGQNTLTGDIANLPSGVTFVNIQGQNTLTGDIANLPSGVTYVVIQGNNTLSDYTVTTFNTAITRFQVVSATSCFDATEVDNLLIDLAATVPGLTYVNISGCAAAPTTASSAAITTLTNNGATVITN